MRDADVTEPVPAAVPIAIDFPRALFAAEALKRAALVMMARVTTSFEDTADGTRCLLTPVSGADDPAILERDFRREVLDQDLRLLVEAQTESVRTAILGLAFSRTGLQG
ncbi:MAG: His-Xaa-Ser system protein HxsD [Sphingomonadales bacterium]|nr:His-Xaa-Ser system protein HxsD [Sphingomonadales bacterium]